MGAITGDNTEQAGAFDVGLTLFEIHLVFHLVTLLISVLFIMDAITGEHTFLNSTRLLMLVPLLLPPHTCATFCHRGIAGL
jgi:hypothetical protein